MKKTVKEGLLTVGKYVKESCEVLIPVLGMALLHKSSSKMLSMIVGYDDAVEEIMHSSMWSEDKKKVMSALKRNESSEFYQAVINVAQSSMWSEDKCKAILGMCEEES